MRYQLQEDLFNNNSLFDNKEFTPRQKGLLGKINRFQLLEDIGTEMDTDFGCKYN